MVVGTSAENHGVREEMVDELQDFMYTSFFRGVTLDYSEFTNTLAVVKDSDELARRRLAMPAAARTHSAIHAASLMAPVLRVLVLVLSSTRPDPCSARR